MNADSTMPGSVMMEYMDILIPLLVAEVVLVAAFSALYGLAVHTRLFLRDDEVVRRIFLSFRSVRGFTGAGFAASFLLFHASFFIDGIEGIALRDTGLTLFLLSGWGGLLRAAWVYFFR